ncbi:MAG: 4-hydroxythreonine-4-phosphate dehydrogenase PdxA [Chloroflexi bacterium RBG_16_56_11]|nr:MAG: 4-hydroxythreonine-4-phosphate dehydrogenase PdxA [Chloroflexi bacterium RBG_16_56_11]
MKDGKMNATGRPIIAVTMGDAAGIGPEIAARALALGEISAICRPILVCSGAVMSGVINMLKSPVKLRPVSGAGDVRGLKGTIDIIDLHNLDPVDFTIGRVCQTCGRASMEYVAAAAEMAIKGEARAMVTTPINKEATVRAGYGDIGHLEYLARLTKTREYATMLVSDPLRVVHLTTHHSLKEACSLVTRERITARLKLIQESFGRWGITRPRIAVAALNPHGGEGGLFGREEIEQISPAIAVAVASGIDARGPLPADSVFIRTLGGEFDVVLAMYHDQGHIPIKVHNFEKSVSVALGLPFIRTSVDHGTAFDIAGRGIANHRSLVEAIKLAVNLTKGKLT